jgi:DNA phosphorothioation-associated putative methyltransferase
MGTLGKQVGQRTYIHADCVSSLEQPEADLVEKARLLVEQRLNATFNLIRIESRRQEVAFLHYPGLGDHPFPTLATSWRVHAPSGLVSYRRYAESLNPPILHRTELLLPVEHPARSRCEALTRTCEAVGLFENPTVIGFQRNWYELIKQRGYELHGFELLPLGNASGAMDSAGNVHLDHTIRRHLTALSRSVLSAPVQSLIRDELLLKETSFFDYGCGRGDDLATLEAAGFQATGWDPHFRPSSPRTAADIVNLGFVINVIEDKDERLTALECAYDLSRKVLSVSAMLTSYESSCGRSFGDGVLTSRSTFQKYYTQSELQQFIEGVLEEDAYPAAPGIFYVFKDRSLEQSYLLRKSSNRSRVARARLAGIEHIRAPRPGRQQPIPKFDRPGAEECIRALWNLCLELGREPDAEEIPDMETVRRILGSRRRALDACFEGNDATELSRAATGRQADILVMLSLRFFERRRKFEVVEPRLRRDIRKFFGSIHGAEEKARELLFSVQDREVIRRASEEASSLGLGWLEPQHSLQLHTSLVERLPAPLRVYIGCASAMAGDLGSFDLVKVHIDSGKVTLMSFDDFEGKPLPALQRRIKVRLRDQDMDVFTYGGTYPPTVLFLKSRYINEEFPNYADQVSFDESLERLRLFDVSAYGPPEAKVAAKLRSARWEVSGFQLCRCTTIPALDEQCGANFCFRDLIQCGETWERLRTDNAPKSPDTYNALYDLATGVLDPVIEYFGAIKLTYGFASPELTRHITGRIEPRIDQHISHELGRSRRAICQRLGAAVDFLVEFEDMREVAMWIASNCLFDRMYFYGPDKPLHVSVGPDSSRKVYELVEHRGRRVPRAIHL